MSSPPLAAGRGRSVIACDPGLEGGMVPRRLACIAANSVVGLADELPCDARAFAASASRNELAVFVATYDHTAYNGGSRAMGIRRPFAAWAGHCTAVRAAASHVRFSSRSSTEPVAARDALRQQGKSHLKIAQTSDCRRREREPGHILHTQPGGGDGIGRLRGYLAGVEGPCRTSRSGILSGERALPALSAADGFDPDRIEFTLYRHQLDLLRAKARLAGKARWCEALTSISSVATTPLRRHRLRLALHHVVELELELSVAAAALVDGGEFWNVGEYVGRNGYTLV